MNRKTVYPETSIKKVDVLAAKGAFNVGCFVSDGKIVGGLSSLTRTNNLYAAPTAAWYMAGMKRHVVFANGRVYHAVGALTSPTNVILSAANPSFIETWHDTVPLAYVIGDNYYYYLSNRKSLEIFKGAAYSCILKNGRIFGIDKSIRNRIKWSGEGGIDDWKEGISGAGWVEVQYGYGDILNLIVYKDKIVAVREHGLTFLSAHGTPENYKLSYLECRLPKIFKNTAAVVGDNLMFCTESGLYYYDGNKAVKCTFDFAEEIKTPTFACAGKGKYFVCGLSKTLGRNVILVYDADCGAAYIVDLAATAVGVGEDVYVYTDRFEFRLHEGGRYTFTSGKIDFSSSGSKVLKELIIDCDGEVEIEVSNGVNWHIVWGVRGKFRPNMRGKSFKIRVASNAKINGLYAVAEVKNDF